MIDASQLRIEASHKKVVEVFSKDYAFTIPAYQRPYAWESTQVQELLADLQDAMAPNAAAGGFYFLGSIVLVKGHGIPASKVVDGQQRLTTLTILFSIIRDLTKDNETRTAREKYIKQVANKDEGIPEALRLQLRQKDQAFFEAHIQTRGATERMPSLEGLTGAKARIIENALIIRRSLDAMGREGRDDLLRFLLQSCYLVVVEVPTEVAARRIFTVLNARGLDLSATDILKADLLERAGTDKEASLAQRWEDVEVALGRDMFTAIFVHIRMIFERDKPRSALETGFPEHVPAFRVRPAEFLSEVLEPYSDALMLAMDNRRLRERFGGTTADLVRSLERLDNRDWLPALLLCFCQSNEGVRDNVPEIVFKLERVAYLLFLTRADINARIARYIDVLDELQPPIALKLRSSNRGKSAGLQIGQEEAFALFDALDGSVYLTSKVVKPLLLRLEQASIDGSANYDYPVISVEHVCPQTIGAGSQWAEWFPNADEHSAWVHSIANLVLLSVRKNSAAQNYDFDKKKRTYFTSGDTCAFTLTSEVRDSPVWTMDELKRRRKVLLQRLAKTWDVEHRLEKWWVLQ
ncbi:DUF262 domain-containing protein [Pseudomonas yamanorum]|uniref:DUF262 domain-containing protein n=1 Tax=Pseudomonas yamanorum TaxID=515393 RepID=A0AAJ3LI29_9PSED|nr:DUF262 domain-containing protein [Pseudomonas yamanorum]NWD43720.1 DUF262 domain-containing protein [Pseudomonas yamanorum]